MIINGVAHYTFLVCVMPEQCSAGWAGMHLAIKVRNPTKANHTLGSEEIHHFMSDEFAADLVLLKFKFQAEVLMHSTM